MKTPEISNFLQRLTGGVVLAVLVACASIWVARVDHKIDSSNGQLDATAHQVLSLQEQLSSMGMDFDKLASEDQKKITTLESQLASLGAQSHDRLVSLEQQLQEANSRTTHKFGAAAGYVFAGGEQRYQNFARLREYALDWVSVPATTWTTIYTMPALVSGELNAYAGLSYITYDNSDAAVDCDGGKCDGVIRRYVPGRYQGGDFCRPDGVCASGGSFDVSVDSYVSSTGIQAGALARISWSSPNLLLQVYCPTACRAAAGISGQAMKPYVDSGGADAADSSDGADSGSDAGPPPTIASTNVDFISSTGGIASSLILTGTGFTGATVAISGTTGAPTTVSNTGTVWTLTPAASSVDTAQGNSAVSTITVTNSGGSATFPVWVIPGGTGGTQLLGAWTLQNATTSAGNVATVPDMSGNGNPLNVVGSASPYTANGTTSYVTCGPVANSAAVASSTFPAETNSEVAYAARRTSSSVDFAVPFIVGVGGKYMEFGVTVAADFKQEPGAVNVGTVTVNTDFDMIALFNGASSQVILNGGAPITGGTVTGGASSGSFYLGGYSIAGDAWVGRIYEEFVYSATALNSTGRANLHSYFANKSL